MTATLGVSRATLRKALDVLERDGTIWRHVGKGTFVADAAPISSDNILSELGRQLTPFRMMRARIAIEPGIAREAAMNASGDTLGRMTQAIARSRQAQTWADYEAEDDVFHRTLAEASDNRLLLALFDQLNDVRRAVAWGNVKRDNQRPLPDHISFAEHDAIAAAILDRNSVAAGDAMRAHLLSVAQRLFGES